MKNEVKEVLFEPESPLIADAPIVTMLGIAQDGGVPHIGTSSPAWNDRSLRRMALSLGIVDPVSGERWLIEATPDIKEQLHLFEEISSRFFPSSFAGPIKTLSGIALTHAHVGHYLGLAWLGKEMLDMRGVPVCVMPRMASFLSQNLPWSDLARRGNIVLHELRPNVPFSLNERISLTPIPVPHRDEHSETVGFRIAGPNRSVLFIPDIDRWEDWDAWGERVEEHIAPVDLALLDGTFFSGDELPGRDMSAIPHPTVQASLLRFAELPAEERSKIRFIHLNHSNPLLDPDSGERAFVKAGGCGIAEEGESISL